MTFKETVQNHFQHAENKGLIPLYKSAARKYDIPVSILLAKDSRESWLGKYPGLAANNWYGSDGKSRGISQINVNTYPAARMIDGDSHKWFINQGAQALREELNRFNGNMKAALAAYNTGAGDVRSALNRGKDPDTVTTKGNYVSDILRRSEIIKDELSIFSGLLSGEGVDAQQRKQAAIRYVPGFLIVSAGAYFVKDAIDRSVKQNQEST